MTGDVPMTTILYYVTHTSRFQYNTGIQRCVRSLARALIERGVPLQPVAWDYQAKKLRAASSLERVHLQRWQGPLVSGWVDGDGCQSGQVLPANWLLIPELVSGIHNPSADELKCISLILGFRTAWLFHDAIPVRWAHFYGSTAHVTVEAHSSYMKGLAKADLVISNSRTTMKHLREFWHQFNVAGKARLLAIPLAEELPGTARLPFYAGALRQSHVLTVSSLEPRKNHAGLLKAFAALAIEEIWPKSVELVVVGWGNDARVVKQIERALSLGLPLRWEQNVDDQRLLELYLSCSFTVYPSLEEGFGLPVAESLWHRRPCLCSNHGALAELAAHGGCLMVDTRDWRELKAGLKNLLLDKSILCDLQNQILKRKTRLWSDVAEEWMELLKED